ncbi:MAG TPA: OsmC family protein [Thermoplasmata archaeon]|nr:OsmC family protein [Thermoplasmata archaeon]
MAMQSHATWRGGFETQLEDGRGHLVTIDEPLEDGGTNKGTSAHELLLLSLTGCITTIFHIIANKRKLAFEGFTVSLKAERPRGSPTIQRVHGTVEVRTHAPQEEVDTILRLTVKTCPVGSIFERAQIPVEVHARVIPP